MFGVTRQWVPVAIALMLVEVSLPAASARVSAIHCTASGTKYVSGMTAAEVCARFVRSGRWTAAAAPPANGLRVALSFLPQGIAKAEVSYMRLGRATALPPFELAVSDRRLDGRDIDKLAADVSAGLAARNLR